MRRLRSIHLRDNKLTEVPTKALRQVSFSLFRVDLEENDIERLLPDSFKQIYLMDFRVLKQRCELHVDPAAFRFMPTLKKLDLNDVKMSEFPDLTNTNMLENLRVSKIKNMVVPESFCQGKTELTEISIWDCTMEEFPPLSECKNLQNINVAENKILIVPNNAVSGLQRLQSMNLVLANHGIEYIGPNAFSNLPMLKKLDLSDFSLNRFPNLTGTLRLREIKLDNCNLTSIPRDFCEGRETLKTLKMARNKLTKIPDLSNCKELNHIDLEINQIESIDQKFDGLEHLTYLKLSDNNIRELHHDTFRGMKELSDLYMDRNLISSIHEDAFQDCLSLEILNVSYNELRHLPTRGLTSLLIIHVNGKYSI